jgi:long-chain acyl-CoA synthetase
MSDTVLSAWEKTLRRHGARRAIVEAGSGASCSFRELDARASAWTAQHLVTVKSVRNRAVVFAQPNGIRWFEIFLALVRARAVVVPLDANEPVEAQRRAVAALRGGFWWDGAQLVSAENARRFGETVRLIKLTSGTTGQPRPLIFTDGQLLADARHVTTTMGIRARDLNYGMIPLGHSYGLGNLTLPLIAAGVPLVCGSVALPHAIADDFARWRPTVWPGVPTIFRAMATAEIDPEKLASLRLAISAGAPLPSAVAVEFAARFGERLHNFYGSSETGGIAFDKSGAATLKGGVGQALRGVRVISRRGQRLEVASPAVFTIGNRRRAGKVGAWIPPDQAALDARGSIVLLGRRGSVVKIAGRRINLAEITARLRQLDGVRDAWVAIDGSENYVLGAAVVADRTATELRALLLRDTPTWKLPKRWAVLAEFPVTARGKLDTRALHVATFGAAKGGG